MMPETLRAIASLEGKLVETGEIFRTPRGTAAVLAMTALVEKHATSDEAEMFGALAAADRDVRIIAAMALSLGMGLAAGQAAQQASDLRAGE